MNSIPVNRSRVMHMGLKSTFYLVSHTGEDGNARDLDLDLDAGAGSSPQGDQYFTFHFSDDATSGRHFSSVRKTPSLKRCFSFPTAL